MKAHTVTVNCYHFVVVVAVSQSGTGVIPSPAQNSSTCRPVFIIEFYINISLFLLSFAFVSVVCYYSLFIVFLFSHAGPA